MGIFTGIAAGAGRTALGAAKLGTRAAYHTTQGAWRLGKLAWQNPRSTLLLGGLTAGVGYGVYSNLPGPSVPSNRAISQMAVQAGTSVGQLSPVITQQKVHPSFIESAVGLVQGLHAARHSL